MAKSKDFIYKYRKKLGLTQKQMAEKLNLKLTTYLKYEYGQRQIPVDVCIKILELSGEENDYKIIKCLRLVYGEKEIC